MEDGSRHWVARRCVGLFSVYGGDRPDHLYQALWTILRDQSQSLDLCIGVIEGELSSALERVVNEFSEVQWERIQRVEHPLSFGLPKALNHGLALCKDSDLVFKIDTDDWYPRDRVALTVEAFSKDAKLTFFGGQIIEWNEDATEVVGSRSVPETHEEIVRFGKMRNPMNGPTVAFRCGAVRALGGFMEVGANEDYVLWAALLQEGYRAANSPATLAHMRGGTSLVARRSTARTRKGEYQALTAIYDSGYFNWSQYAMHAVGKQFVRRLPYRWNQWLYFAKLRTNIDGQGELQRANESLNAWDSFTAQIDMQTVEVAAIVVSYNRFALLTEVLRALRTQPGVSEIYIVDNASSGDVVAHLTTDFGVPTVNGEIQEFGQGSPGIKVVRLAENTGGAGGFARGLAWALRDSKAPYLWIMDDDAVPTDGCLEKLLQSSVAQGAGVTVPRIVAHGITKMTYRALGWTPHLVTNFKNAPKSGPIDVFSFVGPLFRREVVLAVDPTCFASMFLHYDDFYYGLRIQLAGFKIWYNDQAIIDHRENSSMHQKGLTKKAVLLRYFGLRNRLWLLLHEPSVKRGLGPRLWAFALTLLMGLRRAFSSPRFLGLGLHIVVLALVDACRSRFDRKLW